MTMTPTLVAGVDSSTQQTKLVVLDLARGVLVHSSALPHPDGTELDPTHWWSALHGSGSAEPHGAAAMSIAAQQHTTIFLDEDGESVRPALLWNDLRAAESARRLREELGDAVWLEATGLLPDSAHAVSKLRWVAEHEPENAARIASVLLPHDWLTWHVLGRQGDPVTDRSDASATGYWSPHTEQFRVDLLTRALGHATRTPAVLPLSGIAGQTSSGTLVASGCGDNGATHLALDTAPGDVVISIGTSITVSMRTLHPIDDPAGVIDTMADPRSGFIPIVVMLNGARVLLATARMLGISLDRLDVLARSGAPDANGALLVPYLDGERNPVADASSGRLIGLSRRSMTPADIARATVLGLGCAIADAFETITRSGTPLRRILLVGGGARSACVRQMVADLIGRAVEWPRHREHAAYGAARQAAWALTGESPDWPTLPSVAVNPSADRAWVRGVRDRYSAATVDRIG
ncbi:xylulokinase [Microbacterium sp. W4I4]|uniref:xylulokinase n=1 Tax=Microbacterium sp. W4I4 TaxID=3042295 RepID=UPI0027802D01|nr:FGGY family carbohydrate kinase [Microbacterium sp. W4I4]MDQ0613941.1 xylulokinase [Microbacterium sp. W4I4]